MIRRGVMAALFLGLFAVGRAHADFQINYVAAESNPTAGSFTYDLIFNSATTSTGPSQTLNTGDFATLYDIQGFNGATLGASTNTFFTLSVQNTGSTPSGVTPTDSSSLPNVTLTYTGAPITTDMTFVGAFTITSSLHSTGNGVYTSQTTKNSNGTLVGSIGTATVPGATSVPEPSSLALCGIAGLTGLGVARARRRAD